MQTQNGQRRYLGIMASAKGWKIEETFATYEELCQWLATDVEIGIEAYDMQSATAIDQARLQGDVAYYL